MQKTKPIKNRQPQIAPVLLGLVVFACVIISPMIVENKWLYSYTEMITSMSISSISSGSVLHHTVILTADEEYALQLYMYKQRTAHIQNASDVVQFMKVYDSFIDSNDALMTNPNGRSFIEANESEKEELLQPYYNLSGSNLVYGSLRDVVQLFNASGGIKRHVYLAHFNENWGLFSDPVLNRTVNWGKWSGHYQGFNDDLWWYLNHTNLSAIVTVQHQWLDHPKVISMPLGSKSPDTLVLEVNKPMVNRSTLLLIAQSDFGDRNAIAERVIANFNGTIRNRYKEEGTNFFDLLRDAKFHLCPSGLGMDSYRTYETIAMGTIPVMEKLGRRDGWYRTYDKLPVLWVDHFDNVTPALLEEQYPRIISKAREYEFERLTQQWWLDLIKRYRFDPPPQVEEVEMQYPPMRRRR